MTQQTKIKAIIFDVDGTLYEPVPALTETLHNYWIKRISDFKRIPPSEAETLYRTMKTQYKSSTRVLEVIGVGDTITLLIQAEKYLGRHIREVLKPDKKLIAIIKKLRSQFGIYTLRNGTRTGTRFILGRIGFENRRQSNRKGFGPFDDLLPTAELGVTKPHPDVFKNALKKLELSAEEVAIVGDRVEIDLVPAKKIGMKTVWVSWGRTLPKTDGVDVVIETIYDMEELL